MGTMQSFKVVVHCALCDANDMGCNGCSANNVGMEIDLRVELQLGCQAVGV